MNMTSAYRLHDDIAGANESSPEAFVEPGTQEVYNAILKEAKRRYPTHWMIKKLHECDHETKYKDLNVLVGQLVTALRELNPLTPTDPEAFYGGGHE